MQKTILHPKMKQSSEHMTRIAFYAGSFDPLTNGHLDVIRQACSIADKLVIGIGVHDSKKALFSFEERKQLILDACSSLNTSTQIVSVAFQGLAVTAAQENEATLMVRGIRDTADLDGEMRMAAMNAQMSPHIQTVFFAASLATRPIAATLVRQIASMGGDVSAFVPPLTEKYLRDHYKK